MMNCRPQRAVNRRQIGLIHNQDLTFGKARNAENDPRAAGGTRTHNATGGAAPFAPRPLRAAVRALSGSRRGEPRLCPEPKGEEPPGRAALSTARRSPDSGEPQSRGRTSGAVTAGAARGPLQHRRCPRCPIPAAPRRRRCRDPLSLCLLPRKVPPSLRSKGKAAQRSGPPRAYLCAAARGQSRAGLCRGAGVRTAEEEKEEEGKEEETRGGSGGMRGRSGDAGTPRAAGRWEGRGVPGAGTRGALRGCAAVPGASCGGGGLRGRADKGGDKGGGTPQPARRRDCGCSRDPAGEERTEPRGHTGARSSRRKGALRPR